MYDLYSIAIFYKKSSKKNLIRVCIMLLILKFIRDNKKPRLDFYMYN